MSGTERIERGDGEQLRAWIVDGWPETVAEAEERRISDVVDPMNPPKTLTITRAAPSAVVVVVCLNRFLSINDMHTQVVRGDTINLTCRFEWDD